MKDHGSLNQESIHQEYGRINDQTIQKDLFDFPVANDPPNEIDIKSKIENRNEIDKKKVIDH
jgi:hypothetical protein